MPVWRTHKPTSTTTDGKTPAVTTTTTSPKRSRKKLCLVSTALTLLILAIALGVGLGIGLTRHKHRHSKSGTATTTPIPATANTTNSTEGSFWRPKAGEAWQIILSGTVDDNDTSNITSATEIANNHTTVPIYDIDLFDVSSSVISALHSQNISVICYFSAGSYEDWRPDAWSLTSDDYGRELDGWPGEYWLNTNSSHVRAIMSSRLQLAAQKGCDGVDPDNVDGYDNENGIGLSEWDSIDYLTFLAEEAHGLGLSVGLKNAGGRVLNQTRWMLQWSVNEQCVQYEECGDFRPFLDLGKPVFHIEYPDGAPGHVGTEQARQVCGSAEAEGFSTVMKDMALDAWVEYC